MQCLKSSVSISSLATLSLFFTLHNSMAHPCYQFSLDANVVQVWCSTGDMTQYTETETISFLGEGRGVAYIAR